MLHTSHMPKETTPHGLFMRAENTPVIPLKPGQADADNNRGLYTQERKTAPENYMRDGQVLKSTYKVDVGDTTKVKDYVNPQKPLIPAALRRKKKEDVKVGERTSAALWGSTYKSTFDSEQQGLNQACIQYTRIRGGTINTVEPVNCVSEPMITSNYRADFGAVPMDLMKKDPSRLPVLKSELTKGTPKATCHIPGFQGFLPVNTANPKCAVYENGADPRQSKHLIGDQFHLNPPGYSGHLPANAINDTGARQVTGMTTFGRDFASNAGFAK